MNKKIIYVFSNGIRTEHTKYIKAKTIKKESQGARTCDIYEQNTKFENVIFGITENQKEYVTRYKFVTTLLLS